MKKNFSTKKQIDSYLKGLDREVPYYFEPDNYEDHITNLGDTGYATLHKTKNIPNRFITKRNAYFKKLKSSLKCQLCEKIFTDLKSMVIDHEHSSRKIRGVLCQNCNHGLGKFMDSPELLEKAASYIRKPPHQDSMDYYTLKEIK